MVFAKLKPSYVISKDVHFLLPGFTASVKRASPQLDIFDAFLDIPQPEMFGEQGSRLDALGPGRGERWCLNRDGFPLGSHHL